MYLLDVVDPAVLVSGGLPAEGEPRVGPSSVPGGVRGEPAGAASHVAETQRLETRHGLMGCGEQNIRQEL